MAESVHTALVPGQNAPFSSQNCLAAQIGSLVGTDFAAAVDFVETFVDFVKASQMAVVVDA
jgi:hypothetical protein